MENNNTLECVFDYFIEQTLDTVNNYSSDNLKNSLIADLKQLSNEYILRNKISNACPWIKHEYITKLEPCSMCKKKSVLCFRLNSIHYQSDIGEELVDSSNYEFLITICGETPGITAIIQHIKFRKNIIQHGPSVKFMSLESMVNFMRENSVEQFFSKFTDFNKTSVWKKK